MATRLSQKINPNSYQGINTTQQFTLIDKFLGYRSREDKTIINPGYMIPGSQNVLIGITGRLYNRKGYTLDGQANSILSGVYAWTDWEEHKTEALHLRAWNGQLEFRYNNGTTIAWTSIKTGLGTSHIRFTNFWDNTEKENVLLFVDGSANVYEWNGANTTFDSATTNTITKQGTGTWGSLGFYVSGNKKIIIGGTEYTYTGGESTTTLTGVTPNPTGAGITAGDLIFQSVVTNGTITGVESAYNFDGISNLDNQVYYGSESNNNIYISKQNDYKDTSFTAPVRIVGEGALATLRSQWRAFVVQENEMYIGAGKSQWYKTFKQLSSDNTAEKFDITPLKTSFNQCAIRQEAVTHDRNSVVIVTNEPRVVTLGRTLNIFGTPMMTDYYYTIAEDMNKYTITNCSCIFNKSYVYITFPTSGKWIVLNQTNPDNVFWEAPQTGNFAGFSIIDGELYAHDNSIPQTYKLFNGYNDNNSPILSRAKFAYHSYYNRSLSDYFNEFWIEGYISRNTLLKVIYNFDLDGCATTISGYVKGNLDQVCSVSADASLGKTSLGKKGLGTNVFTTVSDPLPPYFSLIDTPPRFDFYKLSPEFESYGIDYHWELITFGPLVTQTMYGNNTLKIRL